MEFVWNDGGRAASGFVGTTGDCVTRAIAIATGAAYREVYEQLGQAAAASPRQGISIEVAAEYLSQRQWKRQSGQQVPFDPRQQPKGIVLLHLAKEHGRGRHLSALIDQVVHDTWNPADDEYIVLETWTADHMASSSRLPAMGPKRNWTQQQELTQKEFDRVMRVLRALDKTANNHGSTQAEKHNALRAMQTLMLENNLTRDDIVDQDNVDLVRFTRMTCAVNGRRASGWEKALAGYVCHEILPMVQWYISTKGHRTIFTFYGPLADVQNAIALFRELLLTIASAARLQFGGYSRGSGASYAEGYVESLPKHRSGWDIPASAGTAGEPGLIQTRTLALHDAAKQWLNDECHVRLATSSRAARLQDDPLAKHRGRQHGAQHHITLPTAPSD